MASRRALDQLFNEDTTTSGIPAPMCGAPLLTGPQLLKKRQDRLAKLKSRRLIKEDGGTQGSRKDDNNGSDDQSAIPADAEKVETVSDEENQEAARRASGNHQIEPLIPVTVALVAPDTTPDGEQVLDPSQVPQANRQSTADATAGDESDVLRTLVGAHQRQFKPAVAGPAVTDPGKLDTVATESIVNEGRVAAIAAKLTMESGMPAPTFNKEAASRATNAMRTLIHG